MQGMSPFLGPSSSEMLPDVLGGGGLGSSARHIDSTPLGGGLMSGTPMRRGHSGPLEMDEIFDLGFFGDEFSPDGSGSGGGGGGSGGGRHAAGGGRSNRTQNNHRDDGLMADLMGDSSLGDLMMSNGFPMNASFADVLGDVAMENEQQTVGGGQGRSSKPKKRGNASNPAASPEKASNKRQRKGQQPAAEPPAPQPRSAVSSIANEAVRTESNNSGASSNDTSNDTASVALTTKAGSQRKGGGGIPRRNTVDTQVSDRTEPDGWSQLDSACSSPSNEAGRRRSRLSNEGSDSPEGTEEHSQEGSEGLGEEGSSLHLGGVGEMKGVNVLAAGEQGVLAGGASIVPEQGAVAGVLGRSPRKKR